MNIFTAVVIGFLGSFHCVGMCGPLFLALPHPKAKQAQLFRALVYSLGRSITYMFLGLFFGWFGYIFSITNLQAPLSITLGVLFIVFAITPARLQHRLLSISKLNVVVEKLNHKIKYWFSHSASFGYFGVGLLNGLLPCAFVYAGLGTALTTGNPFHAALFMLLFGLGTIPAMTLVAVAGQSIKLSWRENIQKSLPILAVLLGIMLIMRGLSLNIPFLSPDLNEIIFGSCTTP